MYVCIALVYLHRFTHFHVNVFTTSMVLIANTLLVVGVYTFNKVTDRKEDQYNQRPLQYFTNTKIYSISSFSLGISFLLYVLCEKSSILPYWFVLFFLGIFYSFPKNKRLKNVFILKNAVPAFCWFLSVAILLSASTARLSLADTTRLAFPLFMFVFAFEILWDLPDRRGDKIARVHTLPVCIGFFYTQIVLATMIIGLFVMGGSLTNKLTSAALFFFIIWVSEDTPKYVYHVFLLALICIVTGVYFLDYAIFGR